MIQWPLLRKELGRLALHYILLGAAALALWCLLAREYLPIDVQTAGRLMQGGLGVYGLACLFIYGRSLFVVYRSAGIRHAVIAGVLGAGTLYGIYALFLLGLFSALAIATPKK